MAVLSPDLQRATSGGADEEAPLHVRSTRLGHFRGANQFQRIHEAVPLLTLDREHSLPVDAELVSKCLIILYLHHLIHGSSSPTCEHSLLFSVT